MALLVRRRAEITRRPPRSNRRVDDEHHEDRREYDRPEDHGGEEAELVPARERGRDERDSERDDHELDR